MRATLAAIALTLDVGAIANAAEHTIVPASAAMDHVALYVRDPDRSAAFYIPLFGFRPVPAPVPFARWLVMANGVMLHLVAGRTTPLAHSKWDHIAFACRSMDAMIARLDAKTIPWSDLQGRHSPQVRPDGVRQIFVQDADGYWIEINDALKDR